MTHGRPGAGVLVVTTENIPGHRIINVIGEVVGVSPHSSVGFREGLKSLRTGASVPAEVKVKIMYQSRRDAVEDLMRRAFEMGANAVIGMRFDHRLVSETWNEVCAYGTAVCAVPSAAGRVSGGVVAVSAAASGRALQPG